MPQSPACAQWYADTMTHLRKGELDKLVPSPCTSECHHCFDRIGDTSYHIPRPLPEIIYLDHTPEVAVEAIRRLYDRPMNDEDWLVMVLFVQKHISDAFLTYLLTFLPPHTSIPTSLLHIYCCWAHRVDYLLGPEVRMNINLQNLGGSTPLLALLRNYYDEALDEDHENTLAYIRSFRIHEIHPYIQTFLERGADPLLANKLGESPLSFVESLTHCPAEEKEALLALLRRYA